MTRAGSKRSSEALRCPICWDQLIGPVATPCGHTFCSQCIRSALNVKKECPVCRVAISSHRALRDAPDEVREAAASSSGLLPMAGQPAREEVGLVTSAAPADAWSCTRCTMLNADGLERCSACACRRPSAHQPVTPPEPPRYTFVLPPAARKKPKTDSAGSVRAAPTTSFRIEYDDGDVERVRRSEARSRD